MTPSTGNYISSDPIGLAGNNPTLYGYVDDVNLWTDPWGLFSDLLPTGDGHHLFPRSIGDRLGIRDVIEGVKWYPNVGKGTAKLHQDLHRALADAGIPFHGSKYAGTLDEALEAMGKAYKSFDNVGYLVIDGKVCRNLTPAQAMDKVNTHIRNKVH